jgi:hypothetical protein
MSQGHDLGASDWTDQDLLTRDEAGQRLRSEIADVRDRLAALRADNREDPPAAAAEQMLGRRLAALERALGGL